MVVSCDYWMEVRPLLSPGRHPALWVTERAAGCRCAASIALSRGTRGRLPGELDLHSLRHRYVTHLVEFDYPERFVQDQVGHAYASTTAIYTGRVG